MGAEAAEAAEAAGADRARTPISMSIMSYNGSAVIAMTGNNCVAICSDMRLGVSQQTVATDFQKVFKIHDRMFVGLSGLATDMQTLYAPPPRSLRPERSVVNDTPRERR